MYPRLKIFKQAIFALTFILDVGFNCKATKMKLLEKTIKIFIKALTIFAITGSKDLISMKQDFTRE